MHAIRSLLSVPGNRERMITKAPGVGADAIILDLEDSVPEDRKPEAREMTAGFLADGAGGAATYVRVNAHDTGHLEGDLDAIVGRNLAGIQLPKTDTPEVIEAADHMLGALEHDRGLEPGSIEVIAGVESVSGVYRCFDILSAAPRVGSVVVGVAENGDLQRDVGFVHTEQGLESLYIRSKVLLEARHAGITNALDGTFSDLEDMPGFEAECGRARQIGYRGKKLIHPKQIEPANTIFMPSAAELDFHLRVIEAMDAAAADGHASTTVDGRMVDIAMVANARRVLAWAGDLGIQV